MVWGRERAVGVLPRHAPRRAKKTIMAKPADRKDRLAAALRANLKRRKMRSRAKAQAGAGDEPQLEGGEAEVPPVMDAGSPPHLRRNMAQNGE